jgi:methionyl aminopeptidase
MITFYDSKEFDCIRKAGKLAAEVLDFITPYVQIGVSTGELNDRCHDFIIKNGAESAPLNYMGYPKSICSSINDSICHEIPDYKKILKEGDIVNLDITVILNGFYGDTSRMFILPGAKIKPIRLVKCTYEAMMAGIKIVKPGTKLFEISKEINRVADLYGYGNGLVREYSGHGIGKMFHGDPQIYHYYLGENYITPDQKIEISPGMCFTVEPMINGGTWKSRVLNDKWTVKTRDGQYSAQFEHTIGVTETGYEIFTLSPMGYTMPPYA